MAAAMIGCSIRQLMDNKELYDLERNARGHWTADVKRLTEVALKEGFRIRQNEVRVFSANELPPGRFLDRNELAQELGVTKAALTHSLYARVGGVKVQVGNVLEWRFPIAPVESEKERRKEGDLLSPKAFSEFAGVHLTFINREIADGNLQAFKTGSFRGMRIEPFSALNWTFLHRPEKLFDQFEKMHKAGYLSRHTELEKLWAEVSIKVQSALNGSTHFFRDDAARELGLKHHVSLISLGSNRLGMIELGGQRYYPKDAILSEKARRESCEVNPLKVVGLAVTLGFSNTTMVRHHRLGRLRDIDPEKRESDLELLSVIKFVEERYKDKLPSFFKACEKALYGERYLDLAFYHFHQGRERARNMDNFVNDFKARLLREWSSNRYSSVDVYNVYDQRAQRLEKMTHESASSNRQPEAVNLRLELITLSDLYRAMDPLCPEAVFKKVATLTHARK